MRKSWVPVKNLRDASFSTQVTIVNRKFVPYGWQAM